MKRLLAPGLRRSALCAGAVLALAACAATTAGPVSSPPPAAAADACPIPGALAHWHADDCLGEAGTDDIIAAGACLERPTPDFRDDCQGKRYYKQSMCRRAIAADAYAGSVDACLADPAFVGRTVRNGGA